MNDSEVFEAKPLVMPFKIILAVPSRSFLVLFKAVTKSKVECLFS